MSTNPLAIKRKRDVPFDATKTGIAINTVLGLPRAAKEVGGGILQSIARNIASAGVTLAKPVGGAEELRPEDFTGTSRRVYTTIFGDENIRSIEDKVASAEIAIKQNEFARETGAAKYALPIAFSAVVGEVALDLTPVGGSTKNATKAFIKETSEAGASKILKTMGVTDDAAIKILSKRMVDVKSQADADRFFDILKQTTGMRRAIDATPPAADDSVSKLFAAIKGAGPLSP